MNAEFKREWSQTYVWIPGDELKQNDYKIKMLQNNVSRNRLEMTSVFNEDRLYYRYLVTGKKTLTSIFSVVEMRHRDVIKILRSVIDTIREGQTLLLEPEDFAIMPGYMFTDLNLDNIGYCCIPEAGFDFPSQIKGLLEYMMNRVAYTDTSAVECVYDCYTMWMHYESLEQLDNRIKKEENILKAMVECPSNEEEYLAREKSVSCEKASEYRREADNTDHHKNEVKKEGYFSWLFGKKAENKNVFRENIEKDMVETQSEKVTLCLYDKNKEKSVYLRDEKTGEMVEINKFPFYIGSKGKYSDYVIEREGVSRMHCCIQKKEDEYWVNDLFSTNSTFLNKQELSPSTMVKICDGDVIRIANEELTFLVEKKE